MSNLFEIIHRDFTEKVVDLDDGIDGIGYYFVNLENYAFGDEYVSWIDYMLDFGICLEVSDSEAYKTVMVVLIGEDYCE